HRTAQRGRTRAPWLRGREALARAARPRRSRARDRSTTRSRRTRSRTEPVRRAPARSPSPSAPSAGSSLALELDPRDAERDEQSAEQEPDHAATVHRSDNEQRSADDDEDRADD